MESTHNYTSNWLVVYDQLTLQVLSRKGVNYDIMELDQL